MKNKILLIGLSIILVISCNKNIDRPSKLNSVSKDVVDAKRKSPEVPLSLFKNNLTNQNRVNTMYGCGSYLSGNYGSQGYYMYPAYNIDLSSTPKGSTITINVQSYDVPNRFTVYDANGQLIAYTSWMGYANYSGPWGQSLNTLESQYLLSLKILHHHSFLKLRHPLILRLIHGMHLSDALPPL